MGKGDGVMIEFIGCAALITLIVITAALITSVVRWTVFFILEPEYAVFLAKELFTEWVGNWKRFLKGKG